MKNLGPSGMEQMIDNMHERAIQFADQLKEVDGYKVLNEISFNQVLVACSTDQLTNQTIKNIQDLRTWWSEAPAGKIGMSFESAYPHG